MTVVIGYVPNQYGEAALQVGLQEAEARQLRVIVVNASRGDASWTRSSSPSRP